MEQKFIDFTISQNNYLTIIKMVQKTMVMIMYRLKEEVFLLGNGMIMMC